MSSESTKCVSSNSRSALYGSPDLSASMNVLISKAASMDVHTRALFLKSMAILSSMGTAVMEPHYELETSRCQGKLSRLLRNRLASRFRGPSLATCSTLEQVVVTDRYEWGVGRWGKKKQKTKIQINVSIQVNLLGKPITPTHNDTKGKPKPAICLNSCPSFTN